MLKLLSKDHNLSLVSRLGLLDKFEQGRVEFELKKVRKVKFWVNLSKVGFQKAVELILWNLKINFKVKKRLDKFIDQEFVLVSMSEK